MHDTFSPTTRSNTIRNDKKSLLDVGSQHGFENITPIDKPATDFGSGFVSSLFEIVHEIFYDLRSSKVELGKKLVARWRN